MRSIGELEAGLRSAKVRLEKTKVDKGRKGDKVRVCGQVDQTQPGVDLDREHGATDGCHGVAQEPGQTVQEVAIARGGECVQPRGADADDEHGEVEEDHHEGDDGEEYGATVPEHVVVGCQDQVTVVGLVKLQVQLDTGDHHRDDGGHDADPLAVAHGVIVCLAPRHHQDADNELRGEEDQVRRLPDERVSHVMDWVGEVEEDGGEATEGRGQRQRHDETVYHPQNMGVGCPQLHPDAGESEEEEHDEDNVRGENENVPHPEIGAPDVCVEDRLARGIILYEARVEECVLEEGILRSRNIIARLFRFCIICLAQYKIPECLDGRLYRIVVFVHDYF